MKLPVQLAVSLFVILTACGKKADHHEHHDKDAVADDDSKNEALYNQVNDLHEEVMFKMEDAYKLKGQLEEKIANETSLSAGRKNEIKVAIAALDSADQAMRDWMHGWMNNPADSVDEVKAREYFESEMEKIKKVGDLMTEAIDRAKEEVSKK